jgi:uncharacterized protein (TIGR00297 family)
MAGGLIGCVLILTQVLTLKYPGRRFYWRKLLHISAIGLCGYVVEQSEQLEFLAIIFLAAAFTLGVVVQRKWLGVSKGRSWGIALFPLAFAILIFLPFGKSEIVTAIYVLTFSDAFAGLIGNRWGKPWTPWKEQKSILGSVVFALTALGIFWWRHGEELDPFLLMAIAIAVSGLEMFSWRGSDNLWIPLGTALFLTVASQGRIESSWVGLATGCFVVLAVLIRSKKWLDPSGIAAAGMLTVWISLLFPIQYLLMPLLFLALGSISSKVTSGAEKDAEQEGRNAVQVLANGSWIFFAGGWATLVDASQGAQLFILVFSIALSDTLSSEWGRYIGGATFDILKRKKVKPGLSGGISWAGTGIGLLGAGLLPLTGFFVFDISIIQLLSITIAAFLGMLVDSLLGSTVQAKYLSESGIWQDGYKNVKVVTGWRWADNHTVNFLSIGLTLLGFLLLSYLA